MLWKFRYRDKFTYQESLCEAHDFDTMTAAAIQWCQETGNRYIDSSVKRAILLSVDKDGTYTTHDPTGKLVVKPAPEPAVEPEKRKVGRPRMKVPAPADVPA